MFLGTIELVGIVFVVDAREVCGMENMNGSALPGSQHLPCMALILAAWDIAVRWDLRFTPIISRTDSHGPLSQMKGGGAWFITTRVGGDLDRHSRRYRPASQFTSQK